MVGRIRAWMWQAEVGHGGSRHKRGTLVVCRQKRGTVVAGKRVVWRQQLLEGSCPEAGRAKGRRATEPGGH